MEAVPEGVLRQGAVNAWVVQRQAEVDLSSLEVARLGIQEEVLPQEAEVHACVVAFPVPQVP